MFLDRHLRRSMAEIKSTIELVMERTRHLTLSEEEKREQEIAESRKKLTYLIQKYMDDLLNLETLERELHSLWPDGISSRRGMIVEELLQRLKLGGDNEAVLTLFEKLVGIQKEGISSILALYQAAVDQAAQNRLEDLRQNLLTSYGISGSAVVPNLEADKKWADELRAIEKDYMRKLSDTVTRI